MIHDAPRLAPTPQFSANAREDADTFVAQAIEIITRARSLVAIDRAEASDLLRIDRSRVFELLGRYQRFKHSVIFDPVIQSGDKAQSVTARLLKCECVMMGEAFGRYVSRWQHVNVAADWQAYRGEMIAMSDQLLEHLRVEHAAITALLANRPMAGSNGGGESVASDLPLACDTPRAAHG